MRKSGNQNGKSSSSYGKELDLIGVAQKNMDLAKDNVKLRAQNAQLTSELVCIKNQQFQVQRKEAELKKNIKSQMPHFALMVTYLMEYCESDVTVPNKIFRSRVSSKQNNSTQRVGPHMVNGIVLNASPKISLTRMNPVCSSAGLSSTSTNSIEPAHSESASLSSANSDSSEHNVRDEDFIFRTHRNPFGTSSDEEMEVEIPSESETLSSAASRSNLSTIPEGSEHSISNCYDGLHITLPKMSSEEMRRNSFKSIDSSMEAEASSSCLSFEASAIEHPGVQDTRESKKTRNMTFSPDFNSRRVVNENSTLKEDMSTFACLPTPSMSALGDIDGNYSRLDILFDSAMTSTPTIANNHTNEHSSLLSSKGKSNSMRGSTKLVNPKSGRRRIPIVVLENLPLSSKRLQLGDDTQTELENNSLDTISGSNSNSNLSDKTTKSKSKSTNKGKKRKLVEDGDETSQVVPKHDLPSTSSLSRPQRLAKPTDLKEMGLKQKLRRT
uniref:Shugoshin C-terminal domain-containing protein n=1 Tax=Dendroctonus ponderosae TaxID=77166 RepID=A0AAR5QB12_DENPD